MSDKNSSNPLVKTLIVIFEPNGDDVDQDRLIASLAELELPPKGYIVDWTQSHHQDAMEHQEQAAQDPQDAPAQADAGNQREVDAAIEQLNIEFSV